MSLTYKQGAIKGFADIQNAFVEQNNLTKCEVFNIANNCRDSFEPVFAGDSKFLSCDEAKVQVQVSVAAEQPADKGLLSKKDEQTILNAALILLGVGVIIKILA